MHLIETSASCTLSIKVVHKESSLFLYIHVYMESLLISITALPNAHHNMVHESKAHFCTCTCTCT